MSLNERVAEAVEAPVILIVDPDRIGGWALSLVLQDAGYRTLVARSGEDMLKKVRSAADQPFAIISDYELDGELDGVELARKIAKDTGCRPMTILSSCRDNESAKTQARRAGFLFCSKPMEPRRILGLLKHASNQPDRTGDASFSP